MDIDPNAAPTYDPEQDNEPLLGKEKDPAGRLFMLDDGKRPQHTLRCATALLPIFVVDRLSLQRYMP